jgi:hypothetical protein
MFRISAILLAVALVLPLACAAQDAKVLGADNLSKILPASVFVDGENVPTQKRNAGAVTFGEKKYFIASLVDTSGYSSQYQEKYIGTLITQVPVKLGSLELQPGQYGFGKIKSGENESLAIYDVGGNKIGEVATTKDDKMKPVRPLQIVADAAGAKLYLGPSMVKIEQK